MVGRTFIYDNGASMVRKGYDFAIRRMEHHLRHHFRKHGTDGYILLFDFSKFLTEYRIRSQRPYSERSSQIRESFLLQTTL